MIEAKTYLRLDEGTVPLETFQGQVKDPFYIDGVIDLRIDGVQILTELQWDLVDQLWAYIVDGACHVAQKESFTTCFPDQPLELHFIVSPEGDTVTVKLHYGVAERDAKVQAATIPRREFVAGIADAAEAVFKKLLQVVPENRRGYEFVLGQVETLRQHLT